MNAYSCIEDSEFLFPVAGNLNTIMSLAEGKRKILDAFSSLEVTVGLWGFFQPSFAGISFVKYHFCQHAHALCHVCSVFSKSCYLLLPVVDWGRLLKPVCVTFMKISPLSTQELAILESLSLVFRHIDALHAIYKSRHHCLV